MEETKSEIEARIDELSKIKEEFWSSEWASHVEETIERRLNELRSMRDNADEDIFQSVLKSHIELCKIKQMGLKDAYGQSDPVLYYAAGVAGESGEILNGLVKAARNGSDPEAAKRAVMSELPDVFIYGVILAFILDLDLSKLVAEKATIVIQRALSGYYGGPIKKE
jgi:NTP pyrophosphatase (non-canonical NTP hydrolase)